MISLLKSNSVIKHHKYTASWFSLLNKHTPGSASGAATGQKLCPPTGHQGRESGKSVAEGGLGEEERGDLNLNHKPSRAPETNLKRKSGSWLTDGSNLCCSYTVLLSQKDSRSIRHKQRQGYSHFESHREI